MLNICTYFDSNYLHRGIALYQSILKYSDRPFTLWILCFDQITYDILTKLDLSNIRLIHWEDFEKEDKELHAAKINRSKVEYYWTCTPSLPLYIFKNFVHIQNIIYVDADFYFYASPGTIHEIGNGRSIMIIPHDYSPEYALHNKAGKYNVGVMMFRGDEDGYKCLKWWRERCIEWCYWRYEDNKIGDQAYLNDWPDRFKGVVVSEHAGVNAAPWNISKYELTLDNDRRVFIAGQPLICYHFHACHFCTSKFAFLSGYQVHLSSTCLSAVYRPYLKNLLDIEKELYTRGFNIPMLRTGIPWRYILGLVAKLHPVRNFMLVK